jgi:hypothetical protein
MTDQVDAASPNEPPDPDAEHFAQVTSGIYRRVIPESVWLAIQYAIRNQLPADNPTIMMMFVRIAEVYPEVHEHLQSKLADADGTERSALQLILDPPEGIRQAEYLPDEIQSPGEMDMCWSEFLVTGSTEPVEKVVAVLDREDLSREFVDSMLSSGDPPKLELSDDERNELARYGIALGKKDGPWQIMSPGDIDILVWFGLKDQNPVFSRIVKEMTEDHLVHLANKGAALWSLKANANQHGTIRLLCEAQTKIEGGIGRQLIDPAG